MDQDNQLSMLLKEKYDREKKIADLQNLLLSLKMVAIKLKKQTEDDKVRIEDLQQENEELKKQIKADKVRNEELKQVNEEFMISLHNISDEMRNKCEDFDTRMLDSDQKNIRIRNLSVGADSFRIQNAYLKESLIKKSKLVDLLLLQINDMKGHNETLQNKMQGLQQRTEKDEEIIKSLEKDFTEFVQQSSDEDKVNLTKIKGLEQENLQLQKSVKHQAIGEKDRSLIRKLENENVRLKSSAVFQTAMYRKMQLQSRDAMKTFHNEMRIMRQKLKHLEGVRSGGHMRSGVVNTWTPITQVTGGIPWDVVTVGANKIVTPHQKP